MDITPALVEGAQRITAYSADFIRVNDEEFTPPIIVQALQVDVWPQPSLSVEGIESLLALLGDTEILLIGAGESSAFLPPDLRQLIRAKTWAGVEVMDTGAACRTYNVLLAEGRKVAAALMPF